MKFARREFIIAAGASATASQCVGQETEASQEAKASEGTNGSPVDRSSRRVVVGVMGMQRGLALAKEFAKQSNVEVRYVCDVDRHRLGRAAATMQTEFESKTQPVADFRRILDDEEVSALVCAAPNHWHGPATILACSAGKHTYVEKPASHNPAEGEWMIAAAKKHKRLVQVGMQRRSNVAWQQAIQKLHNGLIGETYLARSWYSNSRGTVGQAHKADVPDYLDYSLWQGPAPQKPFSHSVVPYKWHWHWHWGNGEIGNNGVHTLDLCRWGLQVELPKRTTSVGGRFVFDDAQETPDTNTATFEFEDGKQATWEGNSCHYSKQGFVTFYGDEGRLEVDQNGAHRHFDRKGKLVEEVDGSPHSLRDHIANFLGCIRDEKTNEALNANITIGHRSALLCHLANISYRVKRAVSSDPNSGTILRDDEANSYWQREYRENWTPKV